MRPDKSAGEMIAEEIEKCIEYCERHLSRYYPKNEKTVYYALLLIWLFVVKFVLYEQIDKIPFQFGMFNPKQQIEKGILIEKELTEYEQEGQPYYLYEFVLKDSLIDKKWISYSLNNSIKLGTYVNIETDINNPLKKRIKNTSYNVPLQYLALLIVFILIFVVLPIYYVVTYKSN